MTSTQLDTSSHRRRPITTPGRVTSSLCTCPPTTCTAFATGEASKTRLVDERRRGVGADSYWSATRPWTLLGLVVQRRTLPWRQAEPTLFHVTVDGAG